MRYWMIAAVFPFLFLNADPINTAYDFLDALERADGAGVIRLLSRDLSGRLGEVLDELQLLAAENPSMLTAALARFGGRLSPDDILIHSHDELIGRLLEGRSFPVQDQVAEENAVLEGRNAVVVLHFIDGGSVSFRMVWEESTWKIADTSLLISIL